MTKKSKSIPAVVRGQNPARCKNTAAALASPDEVMAAAQKAERVFSIGAYFSPLYVMREKGHSWRYIVEWLKQFNINISHAHLHRLYAQEDKRRSIMSRAELEALGMPEDMIISIEQKPDPTKRLSSVDAEEIDLEEDQRHEP